VVAGCSASLDARDFPEDPHKGTYAEARYYRYYAEGHPEFSFQRLSGFAQQSFAFFNQKRVIEVRAKTEVSLHSEERVVPFYLQPTLGGDTDLRGFRRYRFYERGGNAINAAGAVVPNPARSKIMDNGDTFFTLNYGGGVKFLNIAGPIGFRVDVRGRTIPNFFGQTTTWLEPTAGVTFSWGER